MLFHSTAILELVDKPDLGSGLIIISMIFIYMEFVLFEIPLDKLHKCIMLRIQLTVLSGTLNNFGWWQCR